MNILDNHIPHLNLYICSVAAQQLAEQNNIDESRMLLEMAEAIRNGDLKVRDPNTGAYFTIYKNMENPSPYLTPIDLNNWLTSRGYPFQWQPNKQLGNAATNISSSKVIQPTPLVKRKVATIFADLHFDRTKWMKHLGDPPKWLEPCRISKGSKGKRVSATWDPTAIGIALLDKNVPIKSLDVVFLSLKDWQEVWKEITEILR